MNSGELGLFWMSWAQVQWTYFSFCIGRKHSQENPPMLYNQNNMASCRELSKLSIDLNAIPSSGRPLKNSRGIHHMFLQITGNNSTQPDQPSTLKNTSLPRRVPTDNISEPDSALATLPSQGPAESFTPCVRQNNRFVDPSGNPLQPGTVIICNKLPFVMSNNSKIYNFTGGSLKQLYIVNPSKHKFLVRMVYHHLNNVILKCFISLKIFKFFETLLKTEKEISSSWSRTQCLLFAGQAP